MKESFRKYPIEQAAAEHGFRAYAEPWKYGVKPDAENDVSDFWLLPDFSDYLRTDRLSGKHIPELRKTSVLRARNRKTGDAAFIISSDLGSFPLENLSGLESMGFALDFARLALQKEKNNGDI